ncbi:MAG: spore coat U domain-containing protein [Pseudomonadota bacterium]
MSLTLHMARRAGSLAVAALLASALDASAASCTVSATAVAFGSYSPLSSTPADANGSVTVSCAPVLVALTLPYTIALSTGSQGSFLPRQMSAGSQHLQYQLYTDLLRTTVWGNGNSGTALMNGNLGLLLVFPASAMHTVYGRIPSLQSSAAAGAYSDVITVTVTY